MWHVKQQFRIILSNSFDKMDNTWNGEDFFRLRNIPKLRIKILFPIQNLRHLAFNENGTCYSVILDHLYQAVNTWCLKDVDWNYKYVVMFSDHTQENQSLSTYISSRKRYCNRDSTCSFAIMIWKFAFCPVLKTKGQTSIFLSTLSF